MPSKIEKAIQHATRAQLKIQIRELVTFASTFARHGEACAVYRGKPGCSCGFDSKLRRVRDVLELMHCDESEDLCPGPLVPRSAVTST